MRRVFFVLRLAAVGYLAAAGGLVFWSRAPQLLGWQPRVVVSGSMLPVIRPGDVALVGPAVPGPGSLPAGGVVLVRDPSRSTGYYLHRLARYLPDGTLVTRGDANDVDDHPAVRPAQVAGRLRLVVPYAGLPMLWWQQRAWGTLAALAALSWAALVLAVAPPRRRRA